MNMMYGKCWDWYMAYICSTWYMANVACRYRVSLLVLNSRSYLFAAWCIELNSCREIPCLCMSTYYSICICWLFFLIVFLTLGNIPIGPASIFFIFYIFLLHLKWDILLNWFDSTVFSMVNFTAVRMATDGDFQALGLVCQGYILALRSFVPSTDKAKEERKSKLLKLTHLLGTTWKSKAASSRGKFSPSDDYPQSPPCKKTQTSKKI